MKKVILSIVLACLSVQAFTQQVKWVYSTKSESWTDNPIKISKDNTPDVEVLTSGTRQTIDGFGACFNELGWVSLKRLSRKDRQSIMKELFAPDVGANFTICRMPVGANDFSLKWYSYDETAGDFGLEKFSIENDKVTLIPFITIAKK